jgi:hypothetical protein
MPNLNGMPGVLNPAHRQAPGLSERRIAAELSARLGRTLRRLCDCTGIGEDASGPRLRNGVADLLGVVPHARNRRVRHVGVIGERLNRVSHEGVGGFGRLLRLLRRAVRRLRLRLAHRCLLRLLARLRPAWRRCGAARRLLRSPRPGLLLLGLLGWCLLGLGLRSCGRVHGCLLVPVLLHLRLLNLRCRLLLGIVGFLIATFEIPGSLRLRDSRNATRFHLLRRQVLSRLLDWHQHDVEIVGVTGSGGNGADESNECHPPDHGILGTDADSLTCGCHFLRGTGVHATPEHDFLPMLIDVSGTDGVFRLAPAVHSGELAHVIRALDRNRVTVVHESARQADLRILP